MHGPELRHQNEPEIGQATLEIIRFEFVDTWQQSQQCRIAWNLRPCMAQFWTLATTTGIGMSRMLSHEGAAPDLSLSQPSSTITGLLQKRIHSSSCQFQLDVFALRVESSETKDLRASATAKVRRYCAHSASP